MPISLTVKSIYCLAERDTSTDSMNLKAVTWYTTMKIYLILLVFVSSQVHTSPVPGKQNSDKPNVLFDQRQEGEVNIRADLKNFVIMIIPKSPEIADSPSSGSLLDLLSKKHNNVKRIKNNQKLMNRAETMHFIESKSAPYHVDITKSSDHLMNDEILATQSPPISLPLKSTEEKSKSETVKLLRQLRSAKFAKAFVLTVPEEEFVLTKMEDKKKVVKKDNVKKNKEATNSEEEMVLIGATEQCGPEMRRDSEGICRMTVLSEHGV
ncbi:uncharacterized protein LOC126741956 [Anthonomus grandis grandis]|uniref:uncharacterized protein LOC126741956 n=1 Tax=Anthonomus grandis grandis TaxID=2921223 RepID=UPI002165A43B|nr:uncharacterized protein LOC126741956 [Anthonomus grandis grandis]